MSTFEFRKHPDCAPGTWWWDGRSVSGPTLSCPNCQKLHSLDHRISVDGTLDASLICLRCSWHQKARLMGWTHGEMDFRTV